MKGAFTIAAKDLRQRIRDRSAITVAFLVPLGLAFILNSSLGNVDADGSALEHRYGVVDLDGGRVASEFAAAIRGVGFGEILELADREVATMRAEDDEIAAAFVIPEGFTQAVEEGRGAEIEVIGNPEASIGRQIARAVAQAFVSELNAIRLAVAVVAEARGEPLEPEEQVALAERARVIEQRVGIGRATGEIGSRTFEGTTYYAVGMAVFFVFFAVEFGARSLLLERQDGTLARLLAAPLTPGMVVAGKVAASFVVGVASMAVLVVGTTLLMGAKWGDPLGVAVLILAAVFAAVGITALVITLARTPDQAASYASMAAVGLGLLGGTFFPISQGGELMAKVSLLAPHAWLMRGFGELSGGAAGVTDILRPAGVVALFGVVFGGIGLLRARRLVARP